MIRISQLACEMFEIGSDQSFRCLLLLCGFNHVLGNQIDFSYESEAKQYHRRTVTKHASSVDSSIREIWKETKRIMTDPTEDCSATICMKKDGWSVRVIRNEEQLSRKGLHYRDVSIKVIISAANDVREPSPNKDGN